MVIDFHVHAFSEKIVERAMGQLEKTLLDATEYLPKTANISPCTDGTLKDLIKKMDKHSIDKGVLLPIATKPSQQRIINNWAKESESDRIISFGSVHPDADDALDELERIRKLGLYGVKLHPDYQNFFVDEERLFPIYRKCIELDLPIIFHAGFDPISPKKAHAMPDAFSKVLDALPNITMVLAHFGGMLEWDMVEEYLIGRGENLYFDLSTVTGYLGDEQAERMIKKHGSNRILFASDMPWDSPQNIVSLVERLDLTSEDRKNILYKNAKRLLKLN